MNTYTTTVNCKCPNGGLEDIYRLKILSERAIQVEHILRTVSEAPKTCYQEDLADFLRNNLGAKIILTGWHHGVKIKSTRK